MLPYDSHSVSSLFDAFDYLTENTYDEQETVRTDWVSRNHDVRYY